MSTTGSPLRSLTTATGRGAGGPTAGAGRPQAAGAAGTAWASWSCGSAPRWVEFDVTAAVTGDGTLGLELKSTRSDGVGYASRERSNPPQLIVTVSG
jgi:hypothetical protein